MVTRLLDLVSSHFDYVVFDMPRTWFSWTDSVLLGSNKLFIVSEMTVPGLRHAKQLVAAVRERLGEGPQPQVIVNRFEQRLFSPGLRKADIEQALGEIFAACIPNHYRLVREAIDRGVPLDEVKPGNKITLQLKKLIAAASRAPRRRRRRAPAWRRSSSCPGRGNASGIRRKDRIEERAWSVVSPLAAPRRRSWCRRWTEPSPALEGVSWTVFPEPGPEPAAAPACQSAAQRQAARRQGPAAPPADRGDQPVGAGEAARGRDARSTSSSWSRNTSWSSGWRSTPQELNDFVSEILDEMTGSGPARAAAQGPERSATS